MCRLSLMFGDQSSHIKMSKLERHLESLYTLSESLSFSSDTAVMLLSLFKVFVSDIIDIRL